MTLETCIAIVVFSCILQSVAFYFILKLQKAGEKDSASEALAQSLRTHSDLREALIEKLGIHFLTSQERFDRTLGLNRGELQESLSKTTLTLENKFQSLEAQVKNRLELIEKRVEEKLNENLKEGFKHFEKVQLYLQAAETQLATVGSVGASISDLNQLLKLPHLRGGFGEAILERLLADFLPHGGFILQYQISPDSTERVDAVVQLAKQVLPIDSKFPREQILPLFDSADPTLLAEARKALAEFVKTQAKQISTKYIRPECGTTDMALIFFPSETIYFEVIRNSSLFENLAKLKVFPVSPNTLAITLRSVTLAQEYYSMAKGIEKTIEDLKKARKHFEHFDKRFEEVGKGIRKAQEAYDTAHSHLGYYESSIGKLTRDHANPYPSLPAEFQ